MTPTTTFSGRDRAILRAVAAGGAEQLGAEADHPGGYGACVAKIRRGESLGDIQRPPERNLDLRDRPYG